MLTFVHLILLSLLSGAYIYESNFSYPLLHIWGIIFIGFLFNYVFDSQLMYYLGLPIIPYFLYNEIMRVPTQRDWQRLGMQAVSEPGSSIQLYLPTQTS